VNELLTYAVMFDSLGVANVQFTIMVMDLEKELSQELKVFCVARLPQSYWNECESLTLLLH